jgi:GNAT superfamily N-acetyltransferase
MTTQAVYIRRLGDLGADSERDEKLYRLINELYEDVPSSEPRTSLTYTYFRDHRQADPRLLPAACFVAVHRGEYVGVTELKATEAEDELTTGLTAVKQPYRHSGLALALKVRSIAYAKAHGCRAIRTSNDALNAPVLALNERLGFVRQPHPWFGLVKQREPMEMCLEL